MTIVDAERAAARWARWLALLGGWLLVGVAVATVIDASLRYALGRPLPGVFEATELILAAIIFFGLPYTTLVDGHVAVDVLTNRLPVRVQSLIVAVNAVVTAALLGIITVQMASLATEFVATARTTITARIPQFPFILPVTVAAALSTLAFVVQALGAFARVTRPELAPPPRPQE